MKQVADFLHAAEIKSVGPGCVPFLIPTLVTLHMRHFCLWSVQFAMHVLPTR